MPSTQTFAIVGAGLAGATAAETLRAEGFDGRLVLIGDEPERPYDRPPLSKAYLRGEVHRDSLYLHDDGFYAEHAIELRTSTPVRSIEPGQHLLALVSGERLGYDRLLLATGSVPRRLYVPGADLEGVLSLRSVRDADRLAEAVGQAERVVVVGTGWIGAEVAASLRQLGHDVTLVGPDKVPLERVLGPEIGRVYGEVHAEHGVHLRLGTKVTAFSGRTRVQEVVTGDGHRVPADLVLVGAGATPRTELAEAAGVAIGNGGVLVDERLETGAPGIYAAGDIAAAWHPRFLTHVRVEHWANALNQGRAAAKSMLGVGAPYDLLPYFYSDQYDVGMEYSGLATGHDRLVVRGDPAKREFVAFWLRGQRVLAGMNVNVWDVVQPIQALIRSGRHVDPERLADPDIPVEELAAEAGDQLPART